MIFQNLLNAYGIFLKQSIQNGYDLLIYKYSSLRVISALLFTNPYGATLKILCNSPLTILQTYPQASSGKGN